VEESAEACLGVKICFFQDIFFEVTNQETEALIKEENIVRCIKSQRLAWYGHVNRMEDNKNVKAIMKWNPFDRRSRGRPKTRWKDDVGADLRAMKITNWKTSIEDKLAWKKIAEQAKTHLEDSSI
jgi:hypothetical protein